MAGRTFTRRAGSWRPGSAPVYVLGHEELQLAAAAALGPERLEEYRERLHGWAKGYRSGVGRPGHRSTCCVVISGCCWMPLMFPGSSAVRLIGPVMTGCWISPVVMPPRWPRSPRSRTCCCAAGNYDLPVLARLNVHRRMIADRNAHVPPVLPTVWATLGYPDRAEALARSITDPGQRARALAGLARAAAEAGDRTGPRRWPAGRGGGPGDHRPGPAGARCWPSWRGRRRGPGDLDRAEAVAGSITDPDQRARGAGRAGAGGGGGG